MNSVSLYIMGKLIKRILQIWGFQGIVSLVNVSGMWVAHCEFVNSYLQSFMTGFVFRKFGIDMP